ncbi:MAG: ABC transporter ATP-binding protein [Lachnospiraceae bacterium]|nr:ABC transporter ATP-binding protein [Lachnospiraceae bacterium]
MRENIKLLGKAFKTSIKIRSKLSLFVVLLGFPIAFVPAVMALKLEDLTNDIQGLVNDATLLKVTLWDGGMLIGLFLLQLFYGFMKSYMQSVDTQITMVRYIKKRMLQHKCEVKYKYIENYDNFNEKITFAETQAGAQVAACFQAITDMLQDMIKFISVLYLLVQVNVWIVVVILITSIPAMIIARKQKDELYYAKARWIRENGLALHYYFICSNDGNLAEIRHLGMLNYLKSRWREFCSTYIEKKRELTVRHVKYNLLADGLRNVVYIAILSFTAYLIYLDKSIGLGIFALVYTLTGQMQDITAVLFNQIMQLISNIDYMKDFFYLDILQKDEEEQRTDGLGVGDIVFEGVKFQYPNGEKQIFEGLNVTIKKGEKVAILGENGSGKSTFISLLCGMFEPDEGQITINEKDVKMHISEVRRNVSVVLQDFGRYNDSLRNNVTISDEEKEKSDKEILELARKLNVMDVIESQENGLDEMIGAFSAESNDLSGGQWQKVAILRAAYRDNASIMILDEPTSALDPLAEAQIYRDFSKLTGERTTILVSHRLGIASLVDRILVFKDGKIIEDGTHEELINRNGEYTRMYKAQAEWYA